MEASTHQRNNGREMTARWVGLPISGVEGKAHSQRRRGLEMACECFARPCVGRSFEDLNFARFRGCHATGQAPTSLEKLLRHPLRMRRRAVEVLGRLEQFMTAGQRGFAGSAEKHG